MPEKIKKLGQFFSVASHSRTLSLLIILLIVAAVPLTVFVAQKQQEIRQRATGGSGTGGCPQMTCEYTEGVDANVCSSGIQYISGIGCTGTNCEGCSYKSGCSQASCSPILSLSTGGNGCRNLKPSETIPDTSDPYPDSQYVWKAHCDKGCNDSSQKTIDRDCPYGNNSNERWCYGFDGGGTKRCLELQEISAGQPSPTPTPTSRVNPTTPTSGGGTGGVTPGTGGGSAPSCDSSQVQMSFTPSSPKSGETIAFNVSGSQGSTYINDVWGPDGGVDCSGGFWGKKECKAKKEGTYNWTHKWKNCAPNNCGVTSSECAKSLNFTITANPTPTSASCPSLTASDAPSELKYACDTANKKTNLSWKAPSNSNVTSYSIRVDKNPHSWNGNCSSPLSGDSCADPTSTSYTIENIDPNASYRVWIHSRDKCGNWSPIEETKAEITFSCSCKAQGGECRPVTACEQDSWINLGTFDCAVNTPLCCRRKDLNLQAWWIDGTDWTPITPRIELIVRDYIVNGEKVCIPEGEKNNIEVYNSETGAKIGLLKNYQQPPSSGGYPPGQSDYNCGAYQDWGKHTAFRLFGTKQQIKDKIKVNKIKFKIPNYTKMSNEVELAPTTPVPTTPACSILNGPCGWGISGQLLGICCAGLRCESYPDGGICKIASDVKSNSDVDRDGCIGIKDIELWLRAYQKTDQPPYSCPSGYTCKENNKYYPDINNDNKIDLLDFSEWVSAMIKREKPC